MTDYATIDGDKAAVLLPKALALAPGDVNVRIDYARLLTNAGQAAQAIAVIGGLRQIGREQRSTCFR